VTLDVADPDEVVRGALARGHTRADFFRRGAAAGGALLVGGVAFGGLPELALAKPSKSQDAAILNFALLLEYLESSFYVEAVDKGALSGETLTFAQTVRDHELAHVAFLKTALGAQAMAKPTFDFKDTTSDPDKFRATSIVLEDTGVSAYDGQGARLTKKTLAAAGTIVSVEARHAAWIRRIAGAPGYPGKPASYPAPAALNPALTMAQVQAAVQSTGFIQGG
jgi:hypothetical protein